MKCSHKYLFMDHHTPSWFCNEAALRVCAHEQEYINFFEVYWCDLNSNNFIMIVLLLMCMVTVFRFLSIVVEEYIAEGVENIAHWLHIPENFAAVTVSCASISAAEIITSLVASEMEGGISYNIGSIFGAGLFVVTCATGLAILQTKGRVRLSSLVAKRDIVFFVVSTLVILAIAWYRWITWWNSLILVLMYVALVASVFITDMDKKKKLTKLKTIMVTEPDNQEIHEKIKDLEGHGEDHKFVETPRTVNSETRKSVAMALGELLITIGAGIDEKGIINTEAVDKEAIDKLANQLNSKLAVLKMFRRKSITELTHPEILLRAFDQAFIWILDMTVLPSDKEEYSKARCMIYPIPGLLFVCLYFNPHLDTNTALVVAAIGAVITVFFYFTLETGRPPRGFVLMNMLGVMAALIWTDLLVEIIIDMVKFIGVRWNLSNAYMGLTIIAAGRALPDLVTTMVLCKHSEKLMVVSSVYVAQVFNLLFGFGLAMLRLTILRGPQHFDLFDRNKLIKNLPEIVVIVMTLLVLVVTGIHLYINQNRIKKWFAKGLIWSYGIFLASVSIIALNNSIRKE